MSVITPQSILRGEKRWRAYKRQAGAKIRGRLLDVGSGSGEFVGAARKAGVEAFGLELSTSNIRNFERQFGYPNTCRPYDKNGLFPFPTGFFKGMHCWYVFEHVARPHEVIAEMSRVAARGCALVLHAQDGRTLFDNHAFIPWLPFLAPPLRRKWLATLTTEERTEYLLSSLFDNTAEDIANSLRFFGWIVEVQVSLPVGVPPLPYPTTLEETAAAAMAAAEALKRGKWPSQPLNYYIYAVKA